MRRRQVLHSSALFALGGLSSTILASCNRSDNSTVSVSPTSGGKSPLRIGLIPWIGWGTTEIAQQKGYFKEVGIEVEQTVFQTVTDVNTALLAKKVDLAWLVAVDLLVLSAQTPDLKFIYASDYSGNVDAIVGVGINKPADLKGKTLAREDIPYEVVFTGKYLESLGLKEPDVNIVSLPVPDASAAFIAGKADAAVLYEPFVGKALKERPGAKILYTAKDSNVIINGLAGSAQILQDRRKDVLAYLKAIGKASAFQAGNPAEAYAMLAKWVGITPGEITGQMKQIVLMDAAANKSVAFNDTAALNVINSINAAGPILQRTGKINKILAGKDLIDGSLVQAL